jgi:hypothetical protein
MNKGGKMKLFTILGGLFAAVAVSAVLSVGVVSPAHAADEKSENNNQVKAEEKQGYSYTAGLGDSYTQIVRKAVQTYGIVNNKDLGNARIVFIETVAAQAAGSPELAEGQKVTIGESDIKSWIEKAEKLSEADVAAWQTYVPFIDFNTNNVAA